MFRHATATFILSVLAIMFCGCGKPAPDPKMPAHPNIVLIVIDTLRKDHVSCYGYESKTTPNIDALSRFGLLFENNVAQAPWTAPSIASIFTSSYPSETGVGVVDMPGGERYLSKSTVTRLDEEAVTLAEILKAGGYKTVGVSANLFFEDAYGLWQGFDEKKYLKNEPADNVVSAAIAMMDKTFSDRNNDGIPFFVYIHFMDVHAPNDPPAPYDNMFPTIDGRPHEKRDSLWDAGEDINTYSSGEGLETPGFRRYRSHRVALYDGSIAYVDSQVARFVEHLKNKGLMDNTVVVITADHGEEFWDHPAFEKQHFPNPRNRYGVGHDHTLFHELLDVPLVITGKGVPAGRVTFSVRNIDVAPTIIGLSGVETGMSSPEGVDLVAAFKAGKLDDMPAYAESIAHGYEMKCAQAKGYKFIKYYGPGGGGYLFNRKADPTETLDVSASEPEKASEMSRMLDAWVAGTKDASGKPVVIDKKMKEQLRSLGYAH